MFERGRKDGSDHGAAGSTETDRQGSSRPGGAELATGGAARGDVAVIGRSIQIDGDLRGEEDLRIEGDVNGTVRLHNNTLTIGSEGKIHADVFAKSVIVDGVMEGDLFGSERISIRSNARVLGNITAPRVSLEDGASFKGSIEMDPEAVKAALGDVASKSRAPSSSAAAGKANGAQQVSQAKGDTDGTGASAKSAG